MKLAALAAALLLTACAAPQRRAAVPLRLIATGTVLDITPRLILEELAWEHIVLVETAQGALTVYAGDEDPGVRPGDRVRVTGELVADDEVAGEVAAL